MAWSKLDKKYVTQCKCIQKLKVKVHFLVQNGGITEIKQTQSSLCSLIGEGEVAFFSTKRWDRRNRVDLIESATPCHDAQVMGLYRDSNPLRLTVLAAMSEDYTTAPQHLQSE